MGGTLVPRVGTERTRKKRRECQKVSMFIIHIIIDTYLLFLCGQRVRVHVPRQRKKKRRRLPINININNIIIINPFLHVFLAQPNMSQFLINIFFLFSSSLPNSFMKKIMQTRNVRVIYILHKDASFFCAHTHKVRCRKSGSREVAVPVSC